MASKGIPLEIFTESTGGEPLLPLLLSGKSPASSPEVQQLVNLRLAILSCKASSEALASLTSSGHLPSQSALCTPPRPHLLELLFLGLLKKLPWHALLQISLRPAPCFQES